MLFESAALVKKLNRTCLDALMRAAGLCLSRTHFSVEVEHWLLKLIEGTDTDLPRLFRTVGIDTGRVQSDLNRVLDRFRTGNERTPPLSPAIDDLIRESWVLASIKYQAPEIRSGVLLLALLADERLGRLARDASRELAKIDPEAVLPDLLRAVSGSVEDEASTESPDLEKGAGRKQPAATAAGAGGPSPTPALDRFTTDLTAKARAGGIDPVVGRDAEIRQLERILGRRRQNNPILAGEAGVGKTAIVEGLARRIAAGDVSENLRDVAIRTLDLGLLQAGAGVKGEFENRLKQVIAEVTASPQPIILFIDEAHTLIGAGGQAGQGDAANLLKPALARGELRTIAATTWAEYKEYFEKDAALERRFQVVKVEEPTEEHAVSMLRGLTRTLEEHHGVRILDEALEAAVRLSARHISGRQLPDKAISLLDTACASVAIGNHATPPDVEGLRREIERLGVEIGILERESLTTTHHEERLAERRAASTRAAERLAGLESRWQEERRLVEQVRGLRDKIEAAFAEKAGEGGLPDLSATRAELDARVAELRQIQGETPLMPVSVDAQGVAEVVAGWTGIPAGRMLADEVRSILELRTKLEARVIGQSHALEAIAQRIQTSRANLTDPRRPIGVFLLAGPSGVGKTETALALADTLYGGERNLVVLNMSEYLEEHSVSKLKGAPAGYKGFGQGGVLTEAIRRRPYCVLLLDEVEKAHRNVLLMFFQVFDKGILEDAEGREIDFKNTVILLTSNVGSETIMTLCADRETAPEPEGLAEALRPDLLKVFPAALLGRLVVVPYYPVADDVMRQIIRIQLDRIGRRLQEGHKARFSYGDSVVEAIAGRCREVESGARNADHILTRTLLPDLSREFLARTASGEAIRRVHVEAGVDSLFRYELE